MANEEWNEGGGATGKQQAGQHQNQAGGEVARLAAIFQTTYILALPVTGGQGPRSHDRSTYDQHGHRALSNGGIKFLFIHNWYGSVFCKQCSAVTQPCEQNQHV